MRRKPAELRVMDGTHREDRHGKIEDIPGTNQALTEVPTPPADLNKDAWEHWNECGQRLLSLGILTIAELPSLRLYAETVRELRWCEADIEENGRIQTSMTSGLESMRPAVKQRDVLNTQLLTLFKRFGFTPSDRSALRKDQPSKRSSVMTSRGG